MQSLDDRKRALRAAVNGRRLQAGPELQSVSEALTQRLLVSGLFWGARTIGLYRSLRFEVQTAGLARALEEDGKRIVYPVVQSGPKGAAERLVHSIDRPRQAPDRVLSFHPHTGASRRGPLGVEEPVHPGPSVPLGEIELFILPGLAADHAGNRLGRGGGYYDATLAAAPDALAVLLLFESGLVPDVPVGEHDVLVDAICTESRLILSSARARERASRGDRVL